MVALAPNVVLPTCYIGEHVYCSTCYHSYYVLVLIILLYLGVATRSLWECRLLGWVALCIRDCSLYMVCMVILSAISYVYWLRAYYLVGVTSMVV